MTGEAIKRLFTGDPRKRWHGNDATRPLIGERSILLLEPDEHLARRKLLLPSFHGERIAGYGDLTQRLVDGEVSRWRVGEEVAVLPKAQDLTIEVILQAALGVSDRTERDRFRKLIDDVLFYPMGSRRSARTARRHRIARGRLREPAAVLAALPTPAVLTYFPELWRRKIWNFGTLRWWRHRGRLLELLDQHVASVRSDPLMAQRTDILATLASARDEDGEALDPADLRDDLLALIGAGHETTAAAIAWGAVFLAHSPDVQQWAAERVGEGDDAALDALVKEVPRIRPPLPIAAGRVLDEPFTIGDHVVPPGTTIMVDAWGNSPRSGSLPRARAVSPRAIPRARAGGVRVDPIRRRRAPVHRLGARHAGDQDCAQRDHPPGLAQAVRANAGACNPACRDAGAVRRRSRASLGEARERAYRHRVFERSVSTVPSR